MIDESDLIEVSERLKPVVNNLAGARIFLTGGTGFFGKWLVESFIYFNRVYGLQAKLVMLSRNPAPFIDYLRQGAVDVSNIEILKGDIVDFQFPAGKFTHVIHAAAPTNVQFFRDRPVETFDLIVRGASRVLDFSQKSGAKKFLFTSSGAVYGKQWNLDTVKVGEDFGFFSKPSVADDAYGYAKQVTEHLCRLYRQQYGMETVSARCFAFVGSYLPLTSHYAAGNFIYDALRGGPITVKGDGTSMRSYLYAGDLATWLWTMVAQPNCGEVYNVGSDEAISIKGLAETLARLTSTKVIIEKSPTKEIKESYVPNISKASSELGLKVWTPLETSLQRALRWERPNIPPK